MLVSHEREKLINAIVFFVSKTKHCHTLKLFKLLNFLDFEHFRQTGFSVTGSEYRAWENGPAPSALWHELDRPGPDLAGAVSISWAKDDLTGEPIRRDIRARRRFDPSHFTPRELEIMGLLAEIFRDAPGVDMTEVSHAPNLPWGKVYQGGQGKSRVIPYSLSLDSKPILPTFPNMDRGEFEHRQRLFAD